MGFPEEIKRIRQRSFFTQEDFAKELNVDVYKRQVGMRYLSTRTTRFSILPKSCRKRA